MKFFLISGSRNPEGQTAQAMNAFAAGAQSEGASCEHVFLPELTIERCRQCDVNGWGDCREKGVCVIEDDLASLLDRIRAADAVVFATPVYFADLSESLRAFLDRLRRVTRHESAKPGIDKKPAIGICVAGGGGGGAPACVASLGKILQTCGFDVVDMTAVRRQNLDLKTSQLKEAGAWAARQSFAL